MLTHMEIVRDAEFESLLPAHTSKQHEQLLLNLLRDRVVINPLVVWKGTGILVDGYNRHRIATDNELPFTVFERDFADRDEVKLWMINHQIGHRETNEFQRAELALLAESIIATQAKAKQGERTDLLTHAPKSSEPVHTRKVLADMANVAESTIDKVKTLVRDAPEEVKEQLRNGDVSISKAHKQLTEGKSDPAPRPAWTITDDQGLIRKLVNKLSDNWTTKEHADAMRKFFRRLADET